MKHYKTLLYCCIVSLLIQNCTLKEKEKILSDPVAEIGGNLEITPKVVDLGMIKEDSIFKAIYYLKNVGNSPTIILEVNPDCHCTGYELQEDTILAGGETELALLFNSKDKYGPQKIYSILRTNSEISFYKLTLKAEIVR